MPHGKSRSNGAMYTGLYTLSTIGDTRTSRQCKSYLLQNSETMQYIRQNNSRFRWQLIHQRSKSVLVEQKRRRLRAWSRFGTILWALGVNEDARMVELFTVVVKQEYGTVLVGTGESSNTAVRWLLMLRLSLACRASLMADQPNHCNAALSCVTAVIPWMN